MKLIKQIAPFVANSTAFERFIGVLEHSEGERDNLFRVLTYHRVEEPDTTPHLDPGLISATPESFRVQMKYLAANYEVVSVQDLITAFNQRGQKILPSRAVVITFDDAYVDFEVFAWPILKQYKLPVTLFVPTGFPDHPEKLFWWDRLFTAVHTPSVPALDTPIGRLPLSTAVQRNQALRDLKNYLKKLPHDEAIMEVDRMCAEAGLPSQENYVLGWASLRKLGSEGVTLGAHTRNHPIMNSLGPDDLQNEVIGSRQDLTRETGSVPLSFAYPSGMYNNDAVKAVDQAGFKLAFTTERGINNLNYADPLRLKRINIGSRTTLSILRAQLLSRSAPLYSLGNKLFN